jgi:hypothetical protein
MAVEDILPPNNARESVLKSYQQVNFRVSVPPARGKFLASTRFEAHGCFRMVQERLVTLSLQAAKPWTNVQQVNLWHFFDSHGAHVKCYYFKLIIDNKS